MARRRAALLWALAAALPPPAAQQATPPGQCADDPPASASLGALGNCSAALAAAGGDCASSMAALDASLAAGAALGDVCASACGWCTSVFAFASDPATLAQPFCTAHAAASCAGGDWGTAVSCAAVDLLTAPHPLYARPACEAVTATCAGTATGGEACDLDAATDGTAACPAGCTPTACAYTPGANSPLGCVVHPNSFTVAEMVFAGAMAGGAEISAACAAQKIDGTAMSKLTTNQLVSYGVPLGDSSEFLANRDKLFKQWLPGLRAYAATQTARMWEGMAFPTLDLMQVTPERSA